MAVATAKVPANAKVGWNILHMVLRMEMEELKPQLESLTEALKTLGADVAAALREMEALQENIGALLREAEALKQETAPLWEDNYSLCGDPKCYGDCRVCQEGEEDYEDDYTEKYCRRGRR
jgi:hypothetical protein